MFKDNLKFVLGAAWRACIVLGLVFFSNCLTNGGINLAYLDTSIIAAGSYLFLELALKFKVKVPETKKAETKFLLFP